MGSGLAGSQTPFVCESDLRAQLKSLGLLGRAVSDAVAVAKRVHADQRRDDGSPYLEEHVFPVAAETAKYMADRRGMRVAERAVLVALMHDVLEESTELTTLDLERAFGTDVSTAIELLTKPKSPASPHKADDIGRDREERYMLRVSSGPLVVRLVKVFDRLNNLACIHKSPSQKRSLYVEETRRFHLPLAQATDPVLAEAMEMTLGELEATPEWGR